MRAGSMSYLRAEISCHQPRAADRSTRGAYSAVHRQLRCPGCSTTRFLRAPGPSTASASATSVSNAGVYRHGEGLHRRGWRSRRVYHLYGGLRGWRLVGPPGVLVQVPQALHSGLVRAQDGVPSAQGGIVAGAPSCACLFAIFLH